MLARSFLLNFGATQYSVGIFPEGSENVVKMPSGFELATISIDPNAIWRAADDLGFGDLNLTISAPVIFQTKPSPLISIRRFLRHFPRMLHNSPASSSQLKFWMDRTLPRLAARLLAFEHSSARDEKISSRQRILGVSERTLENVFNQCFGLSPIRYLRVRRLHQVRRALRASDPRTTSISEIASHFGFFHFGHFAADFKTLYGQTPSTLFGPRDGVGL